MPDTWSLLRYWVCKSGPAMCLALDGDRIAPGGGVLTPASSMGMTLVERLRAADMVFDVATV